MQKKDNSDKKNVENSIMSISEPSKLEKIMNDIKNATFSVLFVLLKEEEDINLLFFIFPTIFDFLQILQFVFHEKVIHLWNASQVFSQVFNFFAFFDFAQYFGKVISWPLYLATFYFFIFLILFIIIDIVYVSISFKRKKFTAIWPLIILRNFVNIAVTFLFLFITEVLLSMIECTHDKERGGYFHNIFNDYQCFKGIHIFHTVVAVLFNIIFSTISLIVVLNYFESRISAKTRLARSNSRAEVWFVLNKITLQILFSFFDSDWVFVIMVFIGGLFLAYYYIYDDPFYDSFIANFYKIISSVYLWSCCVLLILKFIQYQNFSGGFILWISGMPFILLAAISFSKNSMKTISKSHVKFESGQDLVDHIQYILRLVEKSGSSKQSYLYLIGYMQKHKEICNETDCPLKNVKNKGDLISFNMSLIALYQTINRLFEQGIKKFKKSIPLRISYAFFLLERMQNKKRALQELRYAESLKPNFDKEFLIFRYKKIIEDSLNDNTRMDDEDEGVDIVGLIAFETHLKMCIHFIKKSTEYHKEFWNELLKERANLANLNTIGNNINFTVRNSKDNWNKLIKINGNIPAVLKLYSKYLNYVLNEKENGKELMKQFQHLVLKQRTLKKNQLLDFKDLSNSSCLVFVGVFNKEAGFIKKVNKEFMSLFGYTEEEIVNKKLDLIIPEIYRNNHDEYMMDYLNKKGDDSEYINQEIFNFGKTKKGFIIPIKYKVNLYQSMDNVMGNNIQFVASIKADNRFENKLCLLTNHNGVIKDLTSNILNFLDLSPHKIEERRININNYLPKALVLRDYRVKGLELDMETNKGNSIKTLCFMEPILLKRVEGSNSKECFNGRELKGYLAIIEILKNPNSKLNIFNKIQKDSGKSKDLNKINDIWEFIHGPFRCLDDRITMQVKPDSESLSSTQRMIKKAKFNRKIITKRLVKGEIIKLAETKYVDDKESQDSDVIKVEEAKSVFKTKIDDIKKQRNTEDKKIRKDQLNSVIKRENNIRIIQIYKFCSVIWITSLVAFSAILLQKSFSFYSEMNEQMLTIYSSSVNVDKFNSVLNSGVLIEDLEINRNRDGAISDNGLKYSDYYYNKIEENIQFLEKNLSHNNHFNKDIIKTILNHSEVEIDIGSDSLLSEEDGLMNTEHKEINHTTITDFDVFTSKTEIDTLFNFDLEYQSKSEGESGFTEKLSYFNNHEFDIYYVFAVFHDLLRTRLTSSTDQKLLYLENIRERLKNHILEPYTEKLDNLLSLFQETYDKTLLIDTYTFIILTFSFVVTIAFIIYIFYLINLIHRKTEKVLTLFLDIPRKDVVDIKKRCDTFFTYSSNFSLESEQKKKAFIESDDEDDEIDKTFKLKADKLLKKNSENKNFSKCKLNRFGKQTVYHKNLQETDEQEIKDRVPYLIHLLILFPLLLPQFL